MKSFRLVPGSSRGAPTMRTSATNATMSLAWSRNPSLDDAEADEQGLDLRQTIRAGLLDQIVLDASQRRRGLATDWSGMLTSLSAIISGRSRPISALIR